MAVFSKPVFSAGLADILNNTNTGKPVQPAQGLPAMPKPEPVPVPKYVQNVPIPPLPPSLTCKAEWLQGLWELQHVYETPLGTETQAYSVNPFQYLYFGKESRLFRYNAGLNRMDPQMVMTQMKEHSNALLQYVLQDAGMLYFYQDRVASETIVCFIVAETQPPFAAGNLLLMPPKGQINGRLIKVYKKVWPPRPAPQNTQKPPPAVRPSGAIFPPAK